MSTLLIRHADVLTLDANDTLLRNAEIAIRDRTILSIGATPPDFVADEIIDARGCLALPAWFNAHTHSPMTYERGWAEDLPLDRWFNERIWVAESALTEEDVYWGAALAACEMIRGGTVAFADHYFWMHQVARVVQESGMKALLAWCVFGLGPDQEVGHTTLALTADFCAEFQNAAGGRIHTVLGPHSPYICSPEFLREAASVARDLGVGTHIHVSESQEQVDQSLAKYGKTPVAHLAELGLFDRPSIAAHCTVLSDSDIEILRRYPVTVAQCPQTHLKLAMGRTRVPDLLAAGVKVALGTDGPGSNNALDMLQVARLASLVQKQTDPTTMPARTALRLATRGGAQALGFMDSGELAPGKAADLILVNTDRPHWIPRHNLAVNLLYSGMAGDVRDVICDGRVLLRNGELTTLDEERIMREVEARAFRMVRGDLRMVREYKG